MRATSGARLPRRQRPSPKAPLATLAISATRKSSLSRPNHQLRTIRWYTRPLGRQGRVLDPCGRSTMMGIGPTSMLGTITRMRGRHRAGRGSLAWRTIIQRPELGALGRLVGWLSCRTAYCQMSPDLMLRQAVAKLVLLWSCRGIERWLCLRTKGPRRYPPPG
jgi:hypothetical protein